MRTESEIKKLILNTAINDDRIRTVLLNGSRANSKITPDTFQDFDIVYIVKDINSFTNDHNWINIFGEKVILQMPELMGNEVSKNFSFSYLMQFKDGNRIDLTLFPIEKFETDFKQDSLTIVWLDKDNLFPDNIISSDKDYHIKKPSEKEFLDTCNEFWWVSTYVAKGLARNEITYAKEMLETIVRPMFMNIVKWKIGSENDFSVSFGAAGKHVEKYLTKSDYEKLLSTYSDFEVDNNWNSLFVMSELFGEFAKEVSEKMGFNYNIEEENNTVEYLKKYERK